MEQRRRRGQATVDRESAIGARVKFPGYPGARRLTDDAHVHLEYGRSIDQLSGGPPPALESPMHEGVWSDISSFDERFARALSCQQGGEATIEACYHSLLCSHLGSPAQRGWLAMPAD